MHVEPDFLEILPDGDSAVLAGLDEVEGRGLTPLESANTVASDSFTQASPPEGATSESTVQPRLTCRSPLPTPTTLSSWRATGPISAPVPAAE